MIALLLAMTVSLAEGPVSLDTGADVKQGATLNAGDTVLTGAGGRV